MKVGITGHQQLGGTKNEEWVKDKLTELAKEAHIVSGYSCLAAGSDQIFASVIVTMNIPLIVIIPCFGYEATFQSEDNKKSYFDLRNHSEKVVELPYPRPSEEAFYEAGKKLVDMTDTIFAVWDGHKAKGLGGTADIVEYAIIRGRRVYHIDPFERQVLKIES